MGATTANADPVVLKQLYGDIRIRQQFYVIVQFARGDGARAFFFHLRRTGRAQAQIKVSSRQGELVSRGFEQVVGEDGNRGFSFDHSLGRRQLPQKFELADRDLHRCGSRRNRFHRHKNQVPHCAVLLLLLSYIKRKTYKTSSNSRRFGKVEIRRKLLASTAFRPAPHVGNKGPRLQWLMNTSFFRLGSRCSCTASTPAPQPWTGKTALLCGNRLPHRVLSA